MDAGKLRAWWSARQGLDGSLDGKPPAEVLERAGWARSVGGVGPYLTLWARAGTTREAADAAAAKLEIHELPAARGCTYVVPASDFALALKISQGTSDEAAMKTARKLGVTDAEVDKLREKVLVALEKGPLDPDGIKEAVGSAVRNLGPEGVKKGVTTTLPVALGFLQSTGEIRRVPVNGRLDQQRYRYTLWKKNPLAKWKLSPEEAQVESARRYFRWIGPATVAEFQWHSGLGVKAAKAAVAPLGLVPMEAGSERFMFAGDRDALHTFQAPKDPHYTLVSVIDSISLLRRDLKGLLAGADAERSVFAEKDYRSLGGLADLPSHAIMDRGRVVGLWEFDTTLNSIAWLPFIKKDEALEAAVKRTEQYVRDQLGDARSFSLDSPKSRAPRVEALRRAAGA